MVSLKFTRISFEFSAEVRETKCAISVGTGWGGSVLLRKKKKKKRRNRSQRIQRRTVCVLQAISRQFIQFASFLGKRKLKSKRKSRNAIEWTRDYSAVGFSAHLRIWIEFKNVGWTKLKFYLYQNEEWLLLNKKRYIFIKYFLRIY